MERDRVKALFVVRLGFTPAEYDALTVGERTAIIRQMNSDNRRRR